MIKASRDAPEFLSQAEWQRLLDAALRHDEVVFDETREEHAGLRALGSMPRYAPITPFVATVLHTRLVPLLPLLVDALERHGRLSLDDVTRVKMLQVELST